MDKLVKAGIEYGFEECEASFAQDSSMSIDILNGEVSSYENSATSSLSFRGLKNGQMGYCSTNILDDSSLDFLLKSAMENCEVLNDADPQFIYELCVQEGQLQYTQAFRDCLKTLQEHVFC